MRWKIFYADGSIWTSNETFPSGAAAGSPVKGVAVILQYHAKVGRRVLKMAEWYVYDEEHGLWYDQPDAASTLARMAGRAQTKFVVRRGEYMPEDEFEKILIKAHNDPDLPPIAPKEHAHPAWQRE